MQDSRQIGLYDVTSAAFFPGLRIGNHIPSFHDSGTVVVKILVLYISDRFVMPVFGT